MFILAILICMFQRCLNLPQTSSNDNVLKLFIDSNWNTLTVVDKSSGSSSSSSFIKSSSSLGSQQQHLDAEDKSSSVSSARFVTHNGTVITAQRGTTASLPCEVLSLGDGVVSFIHTTYFLNYTLFSSSSRYRN